MPSLIYSVEPLTRPPDRTVKIPGSKSHTNRALICAALAHGTSTLSGALLADDTKAMLSSVDRLGIDVAQPEDDVLQVVGCGGVLPNQQASVDVRQSGTTGRFVAPMLALGTGPYILDGDPQLRARPFATLVHALRVLGAKIDKTELPLQIEGGPVSGGHLSVPSTVSSQFLSGLLLSAPQLSGGLTIDLPGSPVSKPYIDLTLATMASFGVDVKASGYEQFVVPEKAYDAVQLVIEPDASAASYFFASAAITGGRVRVEGLDRSTIQGDLQFVDVLEKMGAKVRYGPGWTEVEGSGVLNGVNVDMSDISDTAQTLAIVACFASSPTTISGIGFIRAKETDRIYAVVQELSRLGVRAEELDDGMRIHPGQPNGGTVETYDDHRMAMSFSLLGLKNPGVLIDNPGCVAKTFPHFFEVLSQLDS